MANMFDKIIEDFLKINGGEEDDIIKAIKELRDKAGDVDEETALELVQQLLESMSGKNSSGDADAAAAAPESSSSDDEIVLSDEDKLTLAENVATIKEYLDSKDYHYSTRSSRPDVVNFEMGLTIENVTYRIKVTAETDPNVCRIAAILPIAADPLYVYPLCLAMAKINYRKRYGAFKYDERDGEISYEYSFRAGHGINLDDLHIYFRAVVNTASDGYAIIRKNCVGRFKGAEIDEILEKIKALAKDLADD